MASVTAIGPDFYRVETESGGATYTYRVVVETGRKMEDGSVVERGQAVVTERTVVENGERTVEKDVKATDAVKDVMDERGYDVR